MPTTVTIPDIGDVDFPDTMTEEEIAEAIERDILHTPKGGDPATAKAGAPPQSTRKPYVISGPADRVKRAGIVPGTGMTALELAGISSPGQVKAPVDTGVEFKFKGDTSADLKRKTDAAKKNRTVVDSAIELPFNLIDSAAESMTGGGLKVAEGFADLTGRSPGQTDLSPKRVAGGVNKVLTGGMEAAAPLLLPAGFAAAPLEMVVGLPAGIMATDIVHSLGDGVIAPEYNDLISTLAGLGIGTKLGGKASEAVEGIMESPEVRMWKATREAKDLARIARDKEVAAPVLPSTMAKALENERAAELSMVEGTTPQPKLGKSAVDSASVLKDAPEYTGPTLEGLDALQYARTNTQPPYPLSIDTIPGTVPSTPKSAADAASTFDHVANRARKDGVPFEPNPLLSPFGPEQALGPAEESAAVLRNIQDRLPNTSVEAVQNAVEKFKALREAPLPETVVDPETNLSRKSAQESASAMGLDRPERPMNRDARRAESSVLSTGVDEVQARYEAALEDVSQKLTNRPYDSLSPSEAAVVEDLVRNDSEGYSTRESAQLNSGLGFLNDMFGGGKKAEKPLLPEQIDALRREKAREAARLDTVPAFTRGWFEDTRRSADFQLADDASPLTSTMRDAVKKGAEVNPSQHPDYLVDRFRSSPGEAKQYWDSTLNDTVKKMTAQEYRESSDAITYPDVKAREIYKQGRVIGEKDPRMKALNKEISEAYKAIEDGEGDQEAYGNLVLDRDELTRSLGQGKWDEMVKSKAPLEHTVAGETADEVERTAVSKYLSDKYAKAKGKYGAAVSGLEDQMVAAGVVSEKLMTRLRKIYPDAHVRLDRILPVDETVVSVVPNLEFNRPGETTTGRGKDLVHKGVGSNAVIKDAYTSFAERLIPAYRAVTANNLKSSLASYADQPVWKDLLKPMSPADIKKEGVPDPRLSFSYLKDGEKVYVKTVDPLIAQSINSVLTPHQLNSVISFVARLSNVSKQLTTGVGRPSFQPTNIGYDFMETMVTAAYPEKLLSPTVRTKALKSAFAWSNPLAEEMTSNGAGYFTTEHLIKNHKISPQRMRTGVKKVLLSLKDLKLRAAKEEIIDTAAKYFSSLEHLASGGEKVGRASVYESVKQGAKGEGRVTPALQGYYGIPEAMVKAGLPESELSALAAMEANNTGPNYGRHGASAFMRAFQAMTPYNSASIRGAFTTTRAGRKLGASRLAFRMAYVAFLPTAVSTIWNLSDPVRAKRYLEMNENERSSYLTLIRDGGPVDEFGKPMVYKFPVPPGAIRSANDIVRISIEELYRQGFDGDKTSQGIFSKLGDYLFGETLEGGRESTDLLDPLTPGKVAKDVGQMVSPTELSVAGARNLIPPIIREPAEQLANYDMRTGQPIVRHPDQAVDSQYTTGRTTEGAINVGHALGVSPERVEHAASNLLGPGAATALGGEDDFDVVERRFLRGTNNNPQVKKHERDAILHQEAVDIISGGLTREEKAVLDELNLRFAIPERLEKKNRDGKVTRIETEASYRKRVAKRAAEYREDIQKFVSNPNAAAWPVERKLRYLKRRFENDAKQTQHAYGMDRVPAE